MAKPTHFNLKQLQVGMHFSGSLFNRKGEVLLSAFHPVQHENLKDWAVARIDEIYTHGTLVQDIKELREILPGYTDNKVTYFLDMYYSSLEMLQVQYSSSVSRADPAGFQKIASLWADLLVKEQDPHLYLKAIRYASPPPDLYFYTHALDVSIFAMALLFRTERSTVRLMQIALSGLLFDIGMMKLPEEYRNADVEYTPAMKDELKRHPIYGYQIITQEMNMPPMFGLAALEHHERFDGRGYPRGLSGIRISHYASIIGLADLFTAQMRERPGRLAKEPAEILKDFVSTTMNSFSQELISLFLNFLTIYPVTSILMLSTGQTVVVTETYSYAPLRPTVMVLCNADGGRDISRTQIVLSEDVNEHIKITGIFDRTLLKKNEQFHIKPILSLDASPDENPNLKNISKSSSESKRSNPDTDDREMSVRL